MSTTFTPADFEALFGVNAGYVETKYQEYLASPQTVGEEWRRFFEETARPVAVVEGGAPAGAAGPVRREETEPVQKLAAERPVPADAELLTGVSAKISRNMEESLQVPTATSTRVIPVKVLDENRRIINEHLASKSLGKASFTHVIAWAMVEALKRIPAMCVSYTEVDGKPYRRRPESINIGLAIDVSRGGTRSLLVPNVKDCGKMTFAQFLAAYDQQVQKARDNKLTPSDFQDTVCTLTNPGTIGTVSSLPRLMKAQSFILATGAIDLPAEYQGVSTGTVAELGISKVMTVSSTYDHRVIQGADSGEFLALLHGLLVGRDTFYERLFADLQIPHRPVSFQRDRRAAPGSPVRASENQERAARVMQFIRAYRVRGYLHANLDPLQFELKEVPELDGASYGLTLFDLDREFFSNGVTKAPIATLREITETLRATYCRNIGVEFMHIADPEQKEWLRVRMEGTRNEEPLSKAQMVRVLDKLVEAEAFERFLHTRFVGHKRFSLEGGETLIPALDALLCSCGESGIGRAVIGMAHRGRLNVLVHILGKSLRKMFSEFEGWIDPESTQGSGDVKYHLGTTGTYKTDSGREVQLELACNPSHLEAVDPVVEGITRALQDQIDAGDDLKRRFSVLPILIHGDAAFAGQGVVAETLNMSQLRGYRTGGTVHIVVNNQIGYTTLPIDARSTPYCTDVAKAIQAPVFHVNGDDPLAAVRMMRLALEYRQRFHRDVVVDIVCYRRHGHNEGDEPSYTQPLLYKQIESHNSVREIYQQFLLRAKVLQPEEVEAANHALQSRLKESLESVRQAKAESDKAPVEPPPVPEVWRPDIDTSVPLEELVDLTRRLATWPESFTPHAKIVMQLERRVRMIEGEQPIDFGLGEHLAFATLLVQGVPIRLAGQDSGRGTFSQRHSVLLDHKVDQRHVPLNHLREGQARYTVIDSLLSEEAALGFEYGYAATRPGVLTLWEAQFGDFCNGAQIQIDQFLAAGEAKWNQRCGLVLLLPHGYDGQGPEHSSARLERFLQLCAENNMRVANPTTPAQSFHLLRQQALDPQKKPLIVMTPKSLLRLKAAGSSPTDFSAGRFQPVILDSKVRATQGRRVVLCSGKVYYDLLELRDQSKGAKDVALVRVEQLYPWPDQEIEAALLHYRGHGELVYCQEEPANMGAYPFLRHRLPAHAYAGRPAAASPATGSLNLHKAQQDRLVRLALGL